MATSTSAIVDSVTAAVAAVTSATVAPAVAVTTSVVSFQNVVLNIERLPNDLRTKGDDWHLSATLTYITTSPVPITYSEAFSGTYDAAVTRASTVIRELATLKAAHDSVHLRINDLSAGKS